MISARTRTRVHLTIAPYLDRERSRAVPLRGHVVPDIRLHAGVNLAFQSQRAGQFADGNAGMGDAVRAEGSNARVRAEALSVDDPVITICGSWLELTLVHPQITHSPRCDGGRVVDLKLWLGGCGDGPYKLA